MRRLLLVVVILSTVSLLYAKDAPQYPQPQGEVMAIHKLVENALVADDQESKRAMVAELKKRVPVGSPVADELIVIDTETNTAEPSAEMRQRLQRVNDMLTFVPLGEAKLPEGFPTYTPVGMIEKKNYPKQRMAMAKRFMTLFGHISSNNIAMTTPVQMEYEVTDEGRTQQQSMAFFYASPEIGKAGERGSVKVVDKEPLEVVSLGIRGGVNTKIIRDAKIRLEKWVAAQAEYETGGPLRVMGYNSPMVRRKNQFHEIQLPLKKVEEPAVE